MRDSYETLGVVKAGKLQIQDRTSFESAIRQFSNGVVMVEVRTPKTRRSTFANRLYWAGYVQPIAEHTGYDKLEIHDYLKRRFLPSQHLMIQNAAGEVIDETDVAPTSRKLTKREFSDYLSAIEVWAVGELGVIVGSSREAA